MDSRSVPRIDRRVAPRTDLTVSAIGIALDPSPTAPPGVDRQQVGVLRRARTEGVTLFDIAAARAPARAEWLLRTAFPEPDPELVVMVALGSAPSPARSGPGGFPSGPGPEEHATEATKSAWLDDARSRLPPGASVMPEIRADVRDAEHRTALVGMIGPLVARHEIPAWSTRLSRETFLAGSFPGIPTSPVVSTELSLLDAPSLAALARPASATSPRLIARDPFAGGRLDGTLLRGEISDRRPGGPPRDLREMKEELAPVLRLGYLTRSRKRTLAQAALHYLLERPETLAVLVPLPDPERWEALSSGSRAAPLDAEELARLEERSDASARATSRGPAPK